MPHWGPTSTASGGMEGRESAAQRAAVASCWARGRGGSDGSLSPGGGGAATCLAFCFLSWTEDTSVCPHGARREP